MENANDSQREYSKMSDFIESENNNSNNYYYSKDKTYTKKNKLQNDYGEKKRIKP
jgi:hypothetical protein